MYSMRMTAICSRVTGWSGANVVPEVPATTPVWYAQRTASLYQSFVRSVNGVVPLTFGSPSRLYRICTICARVVVSFGPNRLLPMPDIS